MRQSPHPKRSRGRGNGRRQVPARPQTFDSNGPSVRIRGNAYQVLEKYLTLARDAQSLGDRISAENYFQHAEHYYRIIKSHDGDTEPTMPRPASRPGRPGDGGDTAPATKSNDTEQPSA